jgi:large subunit ribosomal protein L4
VITENVDEVILKSARNIEGVTVTTSTILSPYTILCGGTLVVDKAAVEKIQEVFA